ncbi:hypothetical protein [Vibrio penaeicida]|uniref:hypothetical protein n=1 Tax=Vibrio penaeicida TaxID=104609 RepID=UPI0011AB69C6|nr:hypothetical protein [Vibrio penaeicida]
MSGRITPTINKTLSSAKSSVELFPENLELLGSISVRQSFPTFLVEKKTQNCAEIYQSFNRQEGKTANVTHCGSGAYQFEQSSHYSGSPHCRVAGNIETCISKELSVEAKSVDLRFKVPQANFGGELREIERKNRISKNLGLVPIRVGDITTFIPAEVTNLSPLPTRVTSRWGASGEEFTSEVIPSAYYELSCPNNSRVASLKIPLVYKNDRLSEIGVHSDSGLSGFSSQAISNFATACGTNPAMFTVVNSQDISEANWRVHLGITDNAGYIPELERLASILVTEAESLIVERQSLETIFRGNMSIRDEIKYEIATRWEELSWIETRHFFNPKFLPIELRATNQSGEYIKFPVDSSGNRVPEGSEEVSAYHFVVRNGLEYEYIQDRTNLTREENYLFLPNFEAFEQFISQMEQLGEEPSLDLLFNPKVHTIKAPDDAVQYPDVYPANWGNLIRLSEINQDINNNPGTVTDEIIRANIQSLLNRNTDKVLGLSSVITHTLSVAKKASDVESEKIRELRAKLLEL